MKFYIRSAEYISAHARSIQDAKFHIKNHCDEIVENFINLMLAPPGCLTIHHWKSEIFCHLYSVPLLSTNNKYPESDKIYQWVFTDQLPELRNAPRIMRIVRNLARKEGFRIPAKFDYEAFIEELIGYLDIYYKWLSVELATYGVVDSDDVQNKLDEIFGFKK